ncbi:MAG: hypothetical protein APR63_05385 [Desulfuromonas sp. SDB]|nr:MAG: hypothetical protein APR63_05385 [Desulfuromonas sp. SDB]
MSEQKKDLFEGGLEQYSTFDVLVDNLLIFLWIFTGGYVCWLFMPVIGWIYLGFGLIMVLGILRVIVCQNCYYHGKKCHSAWGKLSAMYCRQGDYYKFGAGIIGPVILTFWGSMALVPLILGVISIIQNFSLFKIVMMVTFFIIVLLSAVILRKNTCSKCKMKYLCPGSASK